MSFRDLVAAMNGSKIARRKYYQMQLNKRSVEILTVIQKNPKPPMFTNKTDLDQGYLEIMGTAV